MFRSILPVPLCPASFPPQRSVLTDVAAKAVSDHFASALAEAAGAAPLGPTVWYHGYWVQVALAERWHSLRVPRICWDQSGEPLVLAAVANGVPVVVLAAVVEPVEPLAEWVVGALAGLADQQLVASPQAERELAEQELAEQELIERELGARPEGPLVAPVAGLVVVLALAA